MRTTEWLVALGLLACGPGQAVSVTIMTASATNNKKVHLQFETRLEPSGDPSQTRSLGGGVLVTDTVFHRFLSDRNSKTYYGYDISVEAIDKDSNLRVTILPLSIGPERLKFPAPEAWTALTPPRYPEPQMARLGDTMAFDLFINPTTGQKVVEYVRFGDKHRMETATGPARPFTIHDVELEVTAPRITKNGALLEAPPEASTVRGHFVMLYVPPNGRFVLSLVPHPEAGLLKAGEVRGSTLRFQIGEDVYEINSKGRIAPGTKAYDLYVLHDPTYRRSSHPDAGNFVGASDAFEGSR